MNHEVMPEIEDNKASFARLLEKTHDTVASEAEINIEGVPKCVAFTERNQKAIEIFCTHPEKGIFSFDSTKHLLPDIKIVNGKI